MKHHLILIIISKIPMTKLHISLNLPAILIFLMEKVRIHPVPATTASDEIDLSLLALRIIQALLRNFKLLVGIIVLGTLLGLFYHYSATPVYNTSMIASSRVLTFNQVESLVKVLNQLASEGDYALLAKKMNVSLSVAESISQIKAIVVEEKEVKQVIDVNDDESLAFKRNLALADNVAEIVLTTTNNTHLDSIQAGLLFYLESNPFVEKRKAIQKQNLERMQSQLQQEVRKLDSLRLSVNKLISQASASNSTTIITDPSSINKDLVDLYEKEMNVRTELALIDNVQIIQEFTPFEQPAGPGLLKVLAIALGASLLLGFGLVALQEFRRSLRKMSIQQDQQTTRENDLA